MAIKINWNDLQKRFIGGTEILRVYKSGYQVRPDTVPPANDYLCFTANEPNCTIQLSWAYYQPRNVVQLETSYDKVNWTDYTLQSIITLANVWDKVYWRNKSEIQVPFSYSNTEFYLFDILQSCYVSWDVTYLLCKTWTNTINDYDFFNLFASTNIVTPPRIPATTLWVYSCATMFAACSNLESIPAIHATSLWERCCSEMFTGSPKIKLSETQTWEYQTPYRIPTTWTWTSSLNWSRNMFYITWGTFAGTPNVNQTYYTSNTIIS